MNIVSRNAVAVAKAAGLVFATLSIAFAAPAQARLPDLGTGGPLSGGVFHGVPIRPQAVAARPNEVEKGLASGECYTVKQAVRDRLGGIAVRRVQVCE